mmetsp:Transcript_24678/g.59509  ORF Transcript_24678/g.59509 Transcript_24678/m.59509 type:complete len:239 (-) Transcript_24678:100-816(-)
MFLPHILKLPLARTSTLVLPPPLAIAHPSVVFVVAIPDIRIPRRRGAQGGGIALRGHGLELRRYVVPVRGEEGVACRALVGRMVLVGGAGMYAGGVGCIVVGVVFVVCVGGVGFIDLHSGPPQLIVFLDRVLVPRQVPVLLPRCRRRCHVVVSARRRRRGSRRVIGRRSSSRLVMRIAFEDRMYLGCRRYDGGRDLDGGLVHGFCLLYAGSGKYTYLLTSFWPFPWWIRVQDFIGWFL